MEDYNHYRNISKQRKELNGKMSKNMNIRLTRCYTSKNLLFLITISYRNIS